MSVFPDTEFGTRAREKLRTEEIVWLTTTTSDGAPAPNPVWFLWEEDTESVLVYSAHDAKRLEHIAVRPRVALNFNCDFQGVDVVVANAVAEQALDVPAVQDSPVYLDKYAEGIARIGMTTESFTQKYSVPVRVRLLKLRGF